MEKVRHMTDDKKELEFFMVKPDGVARGLVGDCFRRVERAGLKIVAMKLTKVSQAQAEELYKIHKGKDFYDSLIKYIRSGPVVVSVLVGKSAVKITRKIIGATDPTEARAGTVRGDYAQDISHNIVHAADSVENAKRELKIFFDKNSLNLGEEYERVEERWL